MALLEGDHSSDYRFANPNRDHCRDARPQVVRTPNPEVDVEGHIKPINIREVPRAMDVVRATRGVGDVALGFFDVIKFSAPPGSDLT